MPKEKEISELPAQEPVAPITERKIGAYTLIGLRDDQKEVYVTLTNRTYVLDEMTEDQAAQLHQFGWEHIKK
ncbi:hypothetical protein [Tellurirhabdus bombi]|uniref:hypothetical protein n=1 Tax=Tellurirhabdus bombi TaxID=2907205 RepID=UPI001F388A6D|nr:hypothetical protein [Tellurirhabdus bombi]